MRPDSVILKSNRGGRQFSPQNLTGLLGRQVKNEHRKEKYHENRCDEDS